MKNNNIVTIYTDGACKGNPGPGGYGALLLYQGHLKQLSQGFRLTTNNRMELLAVVYALETLKRPCSVEVYSDSKYIVDAMNQGWPQRWRLKNWMRTKTEKAKNADIWERLLPLCDKHEVKFIWVKGHAGNEGNEAADQLAVKGAEDSQNHLIDEAYEKEEIPPPALL